MKLALLDDYQKLALKSADWGRLKGVEISVFHEAFSSIEDAAKKLQPFDMLCLLRERTAGYRIASEYLAQQEVKMTGSLCFGLSHIMRIRRLLEASQDAALPQVKACKS